ncbi:MAG TPA: nodulation protein NfeD, partial [Actinomycetota bacterium]|nr:nodulation protein NfeD [Actinomycetota bacterium]
MRRLALGALAAALAVLLAPHALGQEQRVVEVVELEGVIDPTTSEYLLEQIDDAAEAGSEAVIVQLDTPGGLAVAMEEMVQAILDSDVPIVVWVGPPGAQAASAGVFLVYASDVAAMAGATSIGAAHPVDLSG